MATVSFRIEDEIKDRLDEVVADRGLNLSHLFRQALIDKLSEIEPRNDVESRFPLTVKERLSLVMQLRILSSVCDPHEKPSISEQIEALTSGYELHYPELIHSFDGGLSRRACVEVLDILEMYSELYWGYHKLSDKTTINKDDVLFPGFDGNNESRLRSYANYFLFDLNRYESLHASIKLNDCNSHSPMLDIYRVMLSVFRRLKNPSRPLSADQIREIISARGY